MTLKKVSIFCIKEEKNLIFLVMEELTVNDKRRVVACGDGATSGGVDLSSSTSSDKLQRTSKGFSGERRSIETSMILAAMTTVGAQRLDRAASWMAAAAVASTTASTTISTTKCLAVGGDERRTTTSATPTTTLAMTA